VFVQTTVADFMADNESAATKALNTRTYPDIASSVRSGYNSAIRRI